MTHPAMQAVTSSNVDSVGYDPHTRQLHVKFRGGGHYSYDDVTAQEHADLLDAKSIGAHLRAHVIAKHPHRKHK